MEASADVDDSDVLVNVGNAALHLGDDQAHRRCFTRVLADARDRGAGMTVLYVLPRLAFADFLSGHWSRVREAAEEALSLSESVAQPSLGVAPLAWLTLLAALQGGSEYDELRVRLDAATAQRIGVLTDAVHDLSRWAAGVQAANDGDAPAALHHLDRLRLPAIARMAAIDRFDAADRAGAADQARVWLADLVAFADATEWPWARAAVDHGSALLSDGADAPSFFPLALTAHTDSGRPYAQARTHMAYGELLRRTQHRADARPHLRSALALFEELHAEPLASRVEQELRASGETARRRDPSTLVDLTPMEVRVAQLVAQGMSNKQAAAECWISPRTVGFHLRNVFSKTGVSSRGELVRLGLGQSQPGTLHMV
jgi:DNA-binding CsgD family transcriptional regulator